MKRTGEHLHEPDKQQVECIALKAGVKRKARDTNDTTHHIIGDSLDTATESTVIKLPKLDSLKRTIRRKRQTIDAAPVQPESLDELVIPPEYQMTAKGENFLLYDSGANTQRNVEMLNALIFGWQMEHSKPLPRFFPSLHYTWTSWWS